MDAGVGGQGAISREPRRRLWYGSPECAQVGHVNGLLICLKAGSILYAFRFGILSASCVTHMEAHYDNGVGDLRLLSRRTCVRNYSVYSR
jgi:hypothetical protein